uniref:girdin-like n=1 Tax=Erigeron canadensis TaxID=72917 RepID=UPI001CB9B5B7|nr:girdin-like [Erigeron canadensis]
MKEIIKHKMVNKLHRRNSSASSTASVDYTSGDRLLFKFSSLQALQVPKGWDKLSLSIISAETGKTIAKTGRASAQNGNCQWTEDLSEYIWIPHDYASKGIEQCLYKLLIAMGSGRSGILGDVTVNLSVHLSSETSISIAQPLKNCSHGTILQAEIQCLTPLTNLRNDRWTDTDSFTEDANASDDLDTTSEVSDGRVTRSPESSVSNNFVYTSQAGGISNRDRYLSGGESGRSFDSMDDSLSKGSYSPLRNISEAANDLIGRLDSIGSSNSAQYSSYHAHDSSKPSHSSYSSVSGKHSFSQRQDSGKISHSIPTSPLQTFGSTEFVLEPEGATVDNLRAESRIWERHARKLKVDQNFSREEFRDQTRKLQSASMEIIALQTECDGLKHEISFLKVLLNESEVQKKAAESLKDDIHTELQQEIKFQRDMNNTLSLQLNKTQESNLELVSVLQELEETIEKQKLEIESLISLKNKIKELERDCNDLTHENIELVSKLKESSTDLSACSDLERKCVELEIIIQSFKDKACYLDGELNKHREKSEEQENEVTALKELLKLQQEGKHQNASAGAGIAESNFKDDSGILEKLNAELKSRVKDLDKKLLAKISENEVLQSDCFLKDREIQRLDTQVSDLNLLKSQLMGALKAMQTESTIISECLDKVKSDMVLLNDTKESHVAANKILEKKSLELESCNKELELQLTELEVENLHLSERIAGLEPQLRYLTDARESSRLEMQHSETRVINLQADLKKLEEEAETCKVNMKQKFQEMQKRWLEAQEECEYLKKANPKLQTTAENLIEECSQLQKSNRELRQQRLELYNRCTLLEAELRESQHDFSKFSINLDILEGKFSLMINEIATKEQVFDSELEALYLKNEEQTEKLIMGENLFNQMYSEKMAEIENLQQEVKHLNTQIYSSRDERDSMASEAVHNMHVLRAEKHKLEKAIEDVTEKFRSSEKKLELVQLEYEEKFQDLTVEFASSRENHGVLEANLKRVMELLEYTRSNEEKLRFTVGELDSNLKQCEYQSAQLTEEITSLQDQLQKIPSLQDEVVALKNSLNALNFENERLEASLQLITGDYKELKEEKTSLLQRTYSMQKAVFELEDYKRTKAVLEEQVMRLQGDLTAREALCAQDAELKNELGRLKRSNSQLQWKINSLQDEKDECMKNAQVLEEKLEQTKYLNPDEIECSTNNSAISFRSDSMNSLHEHMKLPENVEGKIQLLEKELAEALEENDMYKSQINSFLSKGQIQQFGIPLESEVDGKLVDKEHEKDVSLLETELKELQERYLHMSLKYAEVEAQREELVSKLKAVRPGKGWFS